MKIGELFVKLGFQSDNAKVRDFVEDLLQLDFAVVKGVAGLYSFYVALRRIMTQAVETALAINNFQIQTGLSGRKLQQWTMLAEQVGASGQDIVSTVKAIQMQSAQIRLGQGNIAPFQMLGIDPRQDPFKILDQVRDRIKKLDPAMARLITSQMGVSEGMLNVLYASDELYASIKNQFALDQEQTNRLMALRFEWTKLTQSIKNASNWIGALLAPAFRHAVMFIEDLIGALGRLMDFLRPLKPLFILMGAGLLAWFWPVVAIITGIILLIDDFYSYVEGGQSVFKGFYDGLADFILGAEEFFKSLWDWIQKVIDGIKEIFSNLANLPFIGGNFSMLAAPAMAAGKVGASSNKQENHFSFIIDGAKGPVAIGEEIVKKLKEVFSDTAYQSPLENK